MSDTSTDAPNAMSHSATIALWNLDIARNL